MFLRIAHRLVPSLPVVWIRTRASRRFVSRARKPSPVESRLHYITMSNITLFSRRLTGVMCDYHARNVTHAATCACTPHSTTLGFMSRRRAALPTRSTRIPSLDLSGDASTYCDDLSCLSYSHFAWSFDQDLIRKLLEPNPEKRLGAEGDEQEVAALFLYPIYYYSYSWPSHVLLSCFPPSERIRELEIQRVKEIVREIER
jgi:hypothetical protein